jgi:LysM repeat protein
VQGQMKEVKQNLEKVVQLLGKGEGNFYTVKAGDSLGLIALNHQTTIGALKKANNLTSDVIVVGQKLKLP